MTDEWNLIYPAGRPINRYQFARHCPNTLNAAVWRLSVAGRMVRRGIRRACLDLMGKSRYR